MKATRDGTTCKSASALSCADSRSLLCHLGSSGAQRTGSGHSNTILRHKHSDSVREGWQEGELGLVYMVKDGGFSLLIKTMTFQKTIGTGSTISTLGLCNFYYLLFTSSISLASVRSLRRHGTAFWCG